MRRRHLGHGCGATLLAFVWLASGCGLLYSESLPEAARGAPSDGASDPVADAGGSPGSPPASPPSDEDTSRLPSPVRGVVRTWTWEDVSRCEEPTGTETLAFYPLALSDGAVEVESTVGSVPAWSLVGESQAEGPSGPCGGIPYTSASGPNGNAYLALDNDPAWDMPQGAIDLWFRYETLPEEIGGILCRDEVNQLDPGHFCLVISNTASSWAGAPGLVVRFQGGENEGMAFLLADFDRVPSAAWHHVLVSWDGSSARLYVNGVLVSNAEGPWSIAGNSLNWAIGLDNAFSNNGVNNNGSAWAGLSVTRVRFSDQPRDFTPQLAPATSLTP